MFFNRRTLAELEEARTENKRLSSLLTAQLDGARARDELLHGAILHADGLAKLLENGSCGTRAAGRALKGYERFKSEIRR